jgi:hypothetical protein
MAGTTFSSVRGSNVRKGAALVLILLFLVSVSILNSAVSAQAPEKNFRDDFAGASLRPEWRVVDQDINRWAIIDDDYLVLVLKSEKNKFCYKYDTPDRYEFILKSILTDLGGGDYFYIAIDNEKNDGIKLLLSARNFLAFKKILQKDVAQTMTHLPASSTDETEYYLKIQKLGIEYIGYVSRDGNSWTEVGRYYFPKFAGSPCFGGLSSSGSEKAVKVNFVELRALR